MRISRATWTFGASVLAFALSIDGGHADLSADLRFCSTIRSRSERLACFDAIGKTTPKITQTRNDPKATQNDPAPKSNWNGPYVGLQIGGSALRGKLTDSFSTLAGRTNNLSGSIGGYAGYNFRIDRSVFGVEADFNAHEGTDRTNVAGLPGYIDPDSSYQTKQAWTVNIRARAGFLLFPNFMIFGAAGLAATDLKLLGPACPRCSSFEVEGIDVLGGERYGWTAGGGVETALDQQVHLKIEYLYSDFGSLRSKGSLNLNEATSQVRSNTGRIGLSYNF